MYWVGLTDAASENVVKTMFGKTPSYIPSFNGNSGSDDYLGVSANSNNFDIRDQSYTDPARKVLCQGRQR